MCVRPQIDLLKRHNDQKKARLASLRAQIEDWKSKARDLQAELDELRTRYHDLTVEHKEVGEKLKESRSDRLRCLSENDRLRKKIHDLEERFPLPPPAFLLFFFTYTCIPDQYWRPQR